MNHRPRVRPSSGWLLAVAGLAAWLAPLASADAQRTATPRQVAVETRFVEVDSRNLRELGVPLFRTGEVQLQVYGLGGTGDGERTVTERRRVTRTETVRETTTVRETVLVDDPEIQAFRPVEVERPVTTERKVKTKKTEKRKRNAAPIQGGFGGAGVAAKYFVTRNVGLGVEGDWIEGESSIGVVKGTVTARFPMGANAPYVFAGAGVQFGAETQAVGSLGGGLEHRFSPHFGIFGDAAWLFGEEVNAVVFRVGLSLAFGPSGEGRGGTVFAPASGGDGPVSWGGINPLAKELRP